MKGEEILLYDLPRLYDRMVAPGPCEAFYRSLAKRKGGPVLELACGTGRLSLPLAADGYEVVGLDASPPMLRQAREKANARGLLLELVEADMRSFDFNREFSLIILSGNSMAHLVTEDDLSACLDCVAQHLSSGGLFAFDVLNPDLLELTQSTPECRSGDVGRYGRWVTAYDPINQVQTIRLPLPGGSMNGRLAPMLLRTFFPQEIPLRIRMAGMELLRRFGDFDGKELTGDSSNQVYVAQRPG